MSSRLCVQAELRTGNWNDFSWDAIPAAQMQAQEGPSSLDAGARRLRRHEHSQALPLSPTPSAFIEVGAKHMAQRLLGAIMDISGLVGRPNNKRLNRVRCFDADAWQDTWGTGRCSSAGISAQHRLYMAVQGQGQCWDNVMVKGVKGKGNRETGRRRNAGIAALVVVLLVALVLR